MAEQISHTGLSLEGLGYLNYLHDVLAQPLGSWEGFYTPQSPSMNFALRYQLAFGAYAVAAMARRTPAYKAPYAKALKGALEKMLDVASWGYWRAAPPSRDGHSAGRASSGHVAVLMGPQAARVPGGPPSDPIVQDNLQYSGHLSTMLGLYEKVTGDDTYDRPFDLVDPASGVAYAYTHGEVAARIHGQMRDNRFGGVCCESGIAYVPCNNHALASNALHDSLHGTTYRDANERWLRSVRDKMILKGPALRGIFAACYVKDLGAGAPVAFNFTDAWGLAFMLPFDGGLVRKLYKKLRRRITTGQEGAYLGSSPLSEKLEISDVPINSGFALIAAQGVGDQKVAAKLEDYALRKLGAGWNGSHYSISGAPRTLHTTALFALASAFAPGGRDFDDMFNSPTGTTGTEPLLAGISVGNGRVGVSYARYDAHTRSLKIVLRHVGEPSQSHQSPSVDVRVTLHNVPNLTAILVDGVQLPEDKAARSAEGALQFDISVGASREVTCVVHVS